MFIGKVKSKNIYNAFLVAFRLRNGNILGQLVFFILYDFSSLNTEG